ncbi:MAG: GSCFA domain-containing protein [Bacteroidia bacterium]
MNFHLPFSISPFSEKINYKHPLLFMGSCFAEEIGTQMKNNKFNTLINPHGIIYNPISIGVALRRYIYNNPLKETDLFYANECYYSLEHHSRFSNTNKQICLVNINEQITLAHEQLKKAEWLFITLGSAFVYKHSATTTIVNNCHKLPQKLFTKELLKINEIEENYKLLIEELVTFNSKLKIIFTVSPVRYIRDGIIENTRSKARLIEAVQQLVTIHTNAFYFPAYEIMMDDLRDYRFYKADLIHPNEQAISYIFEKLKKTMLDEESHLIFEKVHDIIKAITHKPFHSDTKAHQQFKQRYVCRFLQLQEEYPFIEWNDFQL